MQILLKFKRFYEAFYQATDTEHVGVNRLLHVWLEAMLNSSSCIREVSLLTDKNILACYYYDGVILIKKNNYIVVEQISDRNNERKNIPIPKHKFVQILDMIKNDIHPIIKKHTPKEFFFIFDDEWSCTITWEDNTKNKHYVTTQKESKINRTLLTIIPESVQVVDNFEPLMESLCGTNYGVGCAAYTFKYDTNKQINKADAHYFVEIDEEDERVKAEQVTILEKTLDETYQDINDIFRYGANFCEITDPKVISQRITLFWEILHAQLDAPLLKIFECKSYPCHIIFYDLKYIFISDKQGLYIAISASD